MSKDSINHSKTPRQVEVEDDPTQQLVAAIEETFPLGFQQPLVAASKWSLGIYSDHVGVELMLEALERTDSQAFGFFLANETLSLRDIDDIYCFVEDLVEDYDGNRLDNEVIAQKLVSEMKNYHTYASSIRAVSHFLSLDKDSMINEFIIPHYKVSKASHIWLEDRTEIAFSKGTKKAFGFEIANSVPVLDRFFELETSDFVSIFEYILEEQDRVLELKNLEEAGLEKLIWGLTNSVYGDFSHLDDAILDGTYSLEPEDMNILLQQLAEIENPITVKVIVSNIFSTWDVISDEPEVILTDSEYDSETDDWEIYQSLTDEEVSKRILAMYLDEIESVKKTIAANQHEMLVIQNENTWLAKKLSLAPRQFIDEIIHRVGRTESLKIRLTDHVCQYEDSNWEVTCQEASDFFDNGVVSEDFSNVRDIQRLWFNFAVDELNSSKKLYETEKGDYITLRGH